MRFQGVAFSLLVLCSTLVHGGAFRLPLDSFSTDKLEETKAAAKENRKPIGFLLANQSTDSSAATECAVETIRAFKQKTVLVYVDSQTGDWKKLPEEIKVALSSPSAGKYIPIFVVFTSDLKKLIATIPSSTSSSVRARNFREAEKLIREANSIANSDRNSFDSLFKKSGQESTGTP